MDNIGETTNTQHVMKIEISASETAEMIMSAGTVAQPTLTRQTSATKNTCLCSPTTHAGSFRCRLHRTPSLQRTKSIDDSASSALQDSPPNSKANTPTATIICTTLGNTNADSPPNSKANTPTATISTTSTPY